VRTTIVMPGLIRTDMISGFAKARGTRIVGPDMVAAAIVDALRTGRKEVFVPVSWARSPGSLRAHRRRSPIASSACYGQTGS